MTSANLPDGTDPPTMYYHDCLTDVHPQVFEPLLDHVKRDIGDLTDHERADLFVWLSDVVR